MSKTSLPGPVLLILLLITSWVGPHALAKATASDPENQLRMVPGDEKGNDLKSVRAEIIISKTDSLALQQLQKLIGRYRGSPIEAELWFRLAELHMKRAKTARFFELRQGGELAPHLLPKELRQASTKQAIESAIAIYRKIQMEFKEFEDMDAVLFNNGFAHQQLGRDQEAEVLYAKLTRDYPESALIADSELALGEIKYDRKDFKAALDHFLKIRQFPTARSYSYGLYKAAWAYYNLQDGISALKQLEQVIAFGKMVQEKGLDAKMDLRKEALNDMTFFFGDTYPAERAVAYLTKQAGDLPVAPVILRLGRMYNRHSKYPELKLVFEDYLRENPKSDQAHLIRNELVRNYETLKDRDAAVNQLKAMRATCDEQNKTRAQTKLVRSQSQEQSLLAEDERSCEDLLAETSHNLASKWHATWLKSNKTETNFANWAQQAYEIELSVGASVGEEPLKSRYSYAELLFQTNKFRLASAQYSLVAERTSDKKLSHDSAHAALVSLEKANGDKWNEVDEANFKRLAEIYRKADPAGPFMLDIDFKIGLIAYEKSRFAEAGEVFERIGWKYRGSDKGRKAQDLYLDILNVNKQYEQLAARSKELIGFGGTAERIAHLTKINRESDFARVQVLEEKREYVTAIVEYRKFADGNRASDLAPRAWWNATQLTFKINKFYEGAQSLQQYYRRFRNEKNVREALVQAAQVFENLAELRSAATVLEDLSVVDNKSSNQWLGLAADYYRLEGETQKARSLYRQLARGSDLAASRLALSHWYQLETSSKAGDTKEVAALLLSKKVQPETSLILLSRAEALYQQKQFKDAAAESKRILAQAEVAPRARAQAQLILAEIADRDYQEIKIRASAAKIATVIAKKTEHLDRVQRAYQSAISAGDSETSFEAISKLAKAYSHYAQSLRAAQLTGGAGKQEAEALQAEVNNLILPIEDKAVDTLNEGLKVARQKKMRDGTIAKLTAELNTLNQAKSPAPEFAVKAPMAILPTFAVGVSRVGL